MWNFLIRAITFLFVVFVGFWGGWEFMFGAIIFLSVSDKSYPEYFLVGPIFDVNLLFPHGFFTILVSVILISNYLSRNFIKSETNFSRIMKAFIMSLGIIVISFFIFSVMGIIGAKNSILFLSQIFSKIFLTALIIMAVSKIKDIGINVSLSFAK